MRLSEVQKVALRRGSASRWLGAREVEVMGTAFDALERRGLAEVRVVARPYRRHVYRLTPAGVRMQLRLKPTDECTVDELIARHIDGSLSREALDAELLRRTPVQLTIYHWPEGRLSAIVKEAA